MEQTSSPPIRQRVAFLGEANDRATFGAIATEHFFKQPITALRGSFELISKGSHPAIIDALWNREVDFGVVAIENAVDGVVNETARGVASLTARGIHVLEEVVVPVTFYLAAKQPLDLNQQLTVFAHPTAKGQCRKLERALGILTQGKLDIQTVNDMGQSISNGGAAKRAAETSGNCAALVNWQGIEANGLKLVAHPTDDLLDNARLKEATQLSLMEANPRREDSAPWQVGDFEHSITRFWKLGHGNFEPPSKLQVHTDAKDRVTRKQYNRTSILLNLDHDSSGGLHDALEFFSRRHCNLSLVYPIPIPGRRFEYSFMLEYEDSMKVEAGADGKLLRVIDVGGHIDSADGAMRAAYEELRDSGLSLNAPAIFGAYTTQILGAYTCTAVPI